MLLTESSPAHLLEELRVVQSSQVLSVPFQKETRDTVSDTPIRRYETRKSEWDLAIALRGPGLLLFWMVLGGISGCASPESIDMDSYDPSYNQTEIANYYRNQATAMREKADAQATAAVRYEALFGPEADLVSGAKSLAHYYKQTAQELERVAEAHTTVDRNKRMPMPVR